ncbi:MAG: large subunit ribosomal protein [Mycobacterium sp.]|jgi:large subunit ribosomal protein L28|nr:large subunit ribosomal protein [Mycobacterium sp.]
MSAHCQVTGRSPGFGNSVSHSHRRTRRRWNPNIQTKTYFLPSEGRRIKSRVSAKGIKVIDRYGNDPDRLVFRKYDPIARRHVDFREER